MFRLCFIIASILCHLLAAPQARACLGPDLEDTLFFPQIPNPRPGGDVILKVILSKVDDGSAVATVTEILESSGPGIHVGDKLPLRYQFTSCGPNHHEGDQGLIIAKAVTDSQGNRMFYPYMRRIGDSRLTPPSIAGKQSPYPASLNDISFRDRDIRPPLNFANSGSFLPTKHSSLARNVRAFV